MGINGLMMQCFEWNMPADSTLWKTLKKDANKLKTMGVTGVWLPPAFKGALGVEDVGYGVYDTYDLGEFNQKGTIPTKYGTKEEYLEAIQALQAKNINVYADTVLNYRVGCDKVETISANDFNYSSKSQMVGDSKVVKGFTGFNFPGRKNKYSKFKWNWTLFDGVNWEPEKMKGAIAQAAGEDWKKLVPEDKEDYQFLVTNFVDMNHDAVIDELYRWGEWYVKATGVDGLRLDNVHQIGHYFYRGWLNRMAEVAGKDMFYVGEYWHWDVNLLNDFIHNTNGVMSLFDAPLHFRFHDASKANGNFDMSKLLDGTLMQTNPLKAVTFVDNQDTQPGQSLESWVADWFKPLAYAIIMLRQEGYPCVFYGDYYGIPNDNIEPKKKMLDTMMKLRKKFAYGTQHDYFDDPNVVGFTREGDEEHPDSGLAVIMSDGTGGTKRMYIGRQFAGMHFVDAMGNARYNIKIDENGCGDFYVNRGAVAVWIKKDCKL